MIQRHIERMRLQVVESGIAAETLGERQKSRMLAFVLLNHGSIRLALQKPKQGILYPTLAAGCTVEHIAPCFRARLRDAFSRFCKNLSSKVMIIDRPCENNCTNHG